jgi:hypothetical protein
MKLNCERCSFALILVIILVIILFGGSLNIDGAGLSPQFPRQTINDPPNDWHYYPLNTNTNCSNMPEPTKIPDMVGVSYFSDGDFLNATIWLSGPFEKIPTPLIRFPIYAMWFGIIQPYDIQSNVDYTNSIEWNGVNSTWTKSIQEVSSNDTRYILRDNNYTNFFDNLGNKGHVNLSLDLSKVTSPAEYFIIFALFDGVMYRGNACGLLDITDTSFYVPPPKFRASVFPSPLEIRQGEEKTAELRLNSTSVVKPLVHFELGQIPKDIDISIRPNRTYATPAGISTSLIDVKASDKAHPGPYTIQINSTISFPVTIDVSSVIASSFAKAKLNGSDSNAGVSDVSPSRIIGDNISSKIIKSRPSYFTVVVMPYTFEDQFKNFWSIYGNFISLFAGGFTAGAAALTLDRLKNIRKHR